MTQSASHPSASAADLHVHSRYSDRPGEPWMARIRAAESYVAPTEVYERAKARGMQFVTISDHDCIDGAKEIAHLPETFLSCESTVSFPEDDCRVHILVLGITERQFAELDERRRDIYAFQRYVEAENIIASVAHPLYRVNNKLTVEHVEKLLLLFRRFEGTNGMHGRRSGELFAALVRSLDEVTMQSLADVHGIDAAGDTPWAKSLTGGSDDHSGLYIASAFTKTPPAASVHEFLDHLRAGRHEMQGARGSSGQLGHCVSEISYQYFLDRFGHQAAHGVLGNALRKLALRKKTTFWSRVRGVFRKEAPDTRTGREVAGELFGTAIRKSMERLTRSWQRGRVEDGLAGLAHLAQCGLAVAPYAGSLQSQYKDASLWRDVERRFGIIGDRAPRKAWFTDTLHDVNGVSRTIRAIATQAAREQRALTVVTCEAGATNETFSHHRFDPVTSFSVPLYPDQKIAIPPVLDLLRYLEQTRFNEAIVSTPGPTGLTGLWASKLLGLPTCGIYHTDFPAYARRWLGDGAPVEAVTRFIAWFYRQFDTVFARSDAYREPLIELGVEPDRIRVLGGGVDRSVFHPGRRDPTFWRSRGLGDEVKLLYVGRVSSEKNLDVMLRAFESLQRRGVAASLAVVGDGPQREELQQRFGHTRVCFTGYMSGDELAAAYASADVFLFPSLTDTFGNAVLEANASGLPAIVADRGGPREIVRRRGSGLAIGMRNPMELAMAMERLASDAEMRASMAASALDTAEASSWEAALHTLWTDRPLDHDRTDEHAETEAVYLSTAS